MDGKLTERAFRCIFLLIFPSSIEARNGPMKSRCPTSQQPTRNATNTRWWHRQWATLGGSVGHRRCHQGALPYGAPPTPVGGPL